MTNLKTLLRLYISGTITKSQANDILYDIVKKMEENGPRCLALLTTRQEKKLDQLQRDLFDHLNWWITDTSCITYKKEEASEEEKAEMLERFVNEDYKTLKRYYDRLYGFCHRY